MHQHLKDYLVGGLTVDNFMFQPIELDINNPDKKYQSVRYANPHNRRSTTRSTPEASYQPAQSNDLALLVSGTAIQIMEFEVQGYKIQ